MKKIGRYVIRGQLGRGGMARVYKVEMPFTGKIAALKLLRPDPLMVDLMGMENIRRMFLKEATTMANLRHPNVLDIWDFDEDRGRLFYIMDYYCNNLGTMIGERYEVELRSRRIRTEKAVHYTRQVLEGLARLHYAGIIHRDIKPFNILITDQDTVKICDFGLSKLRGETFRGPSQLKVGTPYYAPPEQEKDPDAIDASADLFATGVMLYRMLTGKLPMDDPAPPGRYNPDLDAAWDQFVLKAIQSDPERRFRRAKTMLERLETLHHEWRKRQEQVCLAPDDAGGEDAARMDPGPRHPKKQRDQGIKVYPRSAREVFGLDRLFQPQTYAWNDLEVRDDVAVADRAARLLWERSGSEYPLTWDRAHDHVRALNQSRFSGRSDWRLPTVAELMTLLVETPHGEALCVPPVFDDTQRWLWSCDVSSHIGAWYVSLDLGFVAWHDRTAYYHARAVCDL